jgi:NTE family protein
MEKKYKIGLVLSGGGARGFAHLGIVKALNEKGIYPDIISGVSAGAIAGVFLADGQEPEAIFKFLKKKRIFDFSSIQLPKTGLLSLEGLAEELESKISVKDLKDLKIPLIVTASNITEGKVEYFTEGEISKIVIASSSIPVVFAPVKMGNSVYVDGGLFDNLPVKPLLGKCEKIIAVHINPIHSESNFNNLFKIATRTFHLSVHSTIKNSIEKCDLFIEPDRLYEYEMFEAKKADELYKVGYDYVSAMDIKL